MFRKMMVCFTYIPWILYYYNISKISINELDKHSFSFKWLKQNVLKLLRFDNLVLIGFFILFALAFPKANNKFLIRSLLFFTINLYFFVNSYYNQGDKDIYSIRKKNILFILLLLVFLPIIFYFLTGRYLVSYFVLFGFSFFNYYLTYIVYRIVVLGKNKSGKRKI